MKLSITQIGNPILRTVCKSVENIADVATQELIKNLIDTLSDSGVGIAAPQVGVDARIFLIWLKPSKTRPELVDNWPQVIINPVIKATSEERVLGREWCLSIPKPEPVSQIFGKVPRYQRLEASYFNENGDSLYKRFEWLEARVFQHENHHLDGVLFLDVMDDFSTLCSYEEYLKRLEEEKPQS